MWERYRVLGSRKKKCLKRNACNRYLGNLFKLENLVMVFWNVQKNQDTKKVVPF